MIAISAGHYPAAKGASAGGVTEWDEAVLWASRICHLNPQKFIFVPTGTVRQKVDYVNSIEAVDCLVEIHFNADPSRAGKGCECLYFPSSEEGKRIAEALQTRLCALFPPNRGVKKGWFRGDPKNGPVFILEKTRMPAVIIEPEFIYHYETISAMREAACLVIAEELGRL